MAIRVEPALRARGENALGGARIERAGASGLECTTGFSARTPAGVTGIVTAGHCWNSTTYEDFSGAPEVSMGNGRSPGGDWGDFRFQTVANTEVDDFYYNRGVTRDLSGFASPVSGQTLCKFGRPSARVAPRCRTSVPAPR